MTVYHQRKINKISSGYRAPQRIVAGCCLPIIGYLAGMILALLFRMPKDQVIAISVETGIQQTGIQHGAPAVFFGNSSLEFNDSTDASAIACAKSTGVQINTAQA